MIKLISNADIKWKQCTQYLIWDRNICSHDPFSMKKTTKKKQTKNMGNLIATCYQTKPITSLVPLSDSLPYEQVTIHLK